jgi:hypothetical protein
MIETLHFPSVKSFSLGKNNLPRQTKDNDGKESADELEPNENVVRCGREVRNPLFLLLVLSLSFSFSHSLSLSAQKSTHKSLLSTDFFNLSLSLARVVLDLAGTRAARRLAPATVLAPKEEEEEEALDLEAFVLPPMAAARIWRTSFRRRLLARTTAAANKATARSWREPSV